MSFVDSLNERILKEIVLKARCKKTGKIYPVYEIQMPHTDCDGDTWELMVKVKTESEQIKEHVANGEHWCSSCGTVWPDVWCTLEEVDIIIEKLVEE